MNMLLTVKEEGNLPGIEICCTRNLPIRRHISHSTVTSHSNNNPNLRSSPRSTNPSHLPSSSNRAEPDHPLIPQLSVVAQMGTNTSRSISLRSTLYKDKGPLCFNCQKWGHLAAGCPDRNVFAVSTDNQDNTTLAPTFMPTLFLVGSIFSKPIRFLLDSGADHSLINSNVIEQFKQWNLPVPDLSRPNVFGVSPSLI